jgi:hypothetical protein
MGLKITQMVAAGTLTGTELLEVSQPSSSVTITASTISAQASDNSYNDSGSGFLAAGFAAGDSVRVTGFTGNTANNIAVAVITSVTAAKMVIGGTDGDVIVDDAAGESVTISKWVTRRVTLSTLLAEIGASDVQGTGLDVDAAGFRGIPQNAQTGNYTTLAADAGKHLYHASGAGAGDTYTIDSNANVAYEIGTAITFVNMDSNNLTIAITSDTLYLAGTGTTGSRTLAQYGVATAIKLTSTTWVISGTGLT